MIIILSQVFHVLLRCESDVFACPHPIRDSGFGECRVSEKDPDKVSHLDLVVGSDA